MARVDQRVIHFKQWYAQRFGNTFQDHANYMCPLGTADLDRMYKRDCPTVFNRDNSFSFNSVMKYKAIIENEVRMTGTFEQHLSTYDTGVAFPQWNGTPTQQDTQVRGGTYVAPEAPEPINIEPVMIDDIKFPEFKLHRTGEAIDLLDSDFTDEGGQYGGVVCICTGESGVGKSTLLIDKLAKYKKNNPALKVVYFSTEMTRNDIYFFKQKNPLIGQVPTVFASDYLEGEQIKDAVIQVFGGDYDIILLDSYQDLLGTVKDILGWSESAAGRFIIGEMINAAETRGTCVYAIQHLTKGGQYVGGTYLKHKTTAMMHFMFDSAGGRYVTYSKNRRGGSRQGTNLYFSLDKGTGEVMYDGDRFKEMLATTTKVHEEQERIGEMQDNFTKLMNESYNKKVVRDEVFAAHENDEPESLGLNPEFNPGERPRAQRSGDVQFLDSVAETVEFEDIREN